MGIKTLFGILVLVSTFVFSQENAAQLGNLPSVVSETSGLLFHNGKMITHNDSGNLPQLFEIDTLRLQITRTVTIAGVLNVDWEDLAQDDTYIYIGDFGNNLGTRTDLTVYRISKEAYKNSDTISAERLAFSYEDQTNFSNTGNSDWDAEAFFVLNNQLVILTKQWKSNGTVAYSIPKTPGTHVAKRVEAYDSNGLITGATYNPLSEVLFVIGYTTLLGSFAIRVDAPTNTSIFGTSVARSTFGAGLAQVEGIAYADENTYLVSSESFTNDVLSLDSKLFSFTTTDALPEEEEEKEEEEEIPAQEPQEQSLVLFRAYGAQVLEYELNTDRAILGMAIFDAMGQRLRYQRGAEIETNSIDISTFGSSVYYLTFYLENDVLAKAFAK